MVVLFSQGKNKTSVQSPADTTSPPPSGGERGVNRGSQKSSVSPKTQRFVNKHVKIMEKLLKN